jgi:endogenous inhibitor of DNA gyrase (YacG/DUF329 family)
MTTGYCVKCKETVEITNVSEGKLQRYIYHKRKCPKCGTTVCRIIGKKN